jgi:hypothetical protein
VCEMSYRLLTPLPARTRTSQSTTVTQITRKGLLGSSETSTGRSSPRRVDFHLPEDHTDNFEVQEELEAIEVPEVEEIVDTSHSDYDDAPENDHESSKENEDEPEDEPQALPSIFHSEVSDCRNETSYSSTNHCQSTGQYSEEINCRGSRGHCFLRRIGGRGTGSPVSRSLMLFNISVLVVNDSERNSMGRESNK